MEGLRKQIEQMEPKRYARAAKRAAEVAVRMAEEEGIEVSARIQYLHSASLEELEEQQRIAQENRRNSPLQ